MESGTIETADAAFVYLTMSLLLLLLLYTNPMAARLGECRQAGRGINAHRGVDEIGVLHGM